MMRGAEGMFPIYNWFSGGSPGGTAVKNQPINAGDMGLIPGGDDPLEEDMTTHLVFLPGKSHEQRSLVGCSPWGHRVRHD